jgi:hypothetical protein
MKPASFSELSVLGQCFALTEARSVYHFLDFAICNNFTPAVFLQRLLLHVYMCVLIEYEACSDGYDYPS